MYTLGLLFLALSYTKDYKSRRTQHSRLMDIFLGDKIGFDLLNFLKIKYPDIEIVILTNHAGLPYREVCEKIGAHHFLDKSNDFERISKIINDRHSNNNDNQTKRKNQTWGNSKR